MKSVEVREAEARVDQSMREFESAVNDLITKVDATADSIKRPVELAAATIREKPMYVLGAVPIGFAIGWMWSHRR